VQGTGAAREIADAIRRLNQHSKKSAEKIDVIIVGRGGGSMEDLWAFNEEQVARAVYESEIPIVSAVGHETDFTITDLVADYRAPTPSAAAFIVVRDAAELSSRVEELRSNLRRGIAYYLLRQHSALRDLIESRGFAQTATSILALAGRCRELEARGTNALKETLRQETVRLHNAQRRLLTADLRAPLAVKSARVENLTQRLYRSIQRTLDRQHHQLALTASKLDALSPLSVLGRGYVLVKDESGRLVSRASGVKQGQFIKLRFEDAEVGCRVTEVGG
jgi:exodeoxyribonuclease VII large subunit